MVSAARRSRRGRSFFARKGWWLGLALLALPVSSETLWTISAGNPRGTAVLVTAAVDGDTIRTGRGWRERTVRLKGIDAPETVHPHKPVQFYGPEASTFVRESLLGQWVRLEVEPRDEVDKYGRLLAYVFLSDGTFFNRELVRLGYARAYRRFPSRYADEFDAAETEARRKGQGLWQRRSAGAEAIDAKIIGNRRSRIYHVPGQEHYEDVAPRNRVLFASEDEAIRAGYRRAKR